MSATIYDYVGSNPTVAKQILNEFGYQATNNNWSLSLRKLVASEGEPALKAIVDAHPDKELILEMCAPELSVNGTSDIDQFLKANQPFYNADGGFGLARQQESEAKKTQDNFSLIFLAGAMMISLAILKK